MKNFVYGICFTITLVLTMWVVLYGTYEMNSYVTEVNPLQTDADVKKHMRDDSIISESVFSEMRIARGDDFITEIPVSAPEKIYYASPLISVGKTDKNGVAYVSEHLLFVFSKNGDSNTYGKLVFYGGNLKQKDMATPWFHLDSSRIDSSLKRVFKDGSKGSLSKFRTSVGKFEAEFGSFKDPKTGELLSFAFLSNASGAAKFSELFDSSSKSGLKYPALSDMRELSKNTKGRLIILKSDKSGKSDAKK